MSADKGDDSDDSLSLTANSKDTTRLMVADPGLHPYGGLPEKQVDRHRLGRPSLKITRQRSLSEADAFVVEVWNPFTGSYQLADTVQHAMRRVEELASLIYEMRLRGIQSGTCSPMHLT